MNDREFNEELRRFLMKEPGESVESVLDRLLHAPAGVQQSAKEVIQRLLTDAEKKTEPSGPPSTEEQREIALLKGKVAYVFLVTLGLSARETMTWALAGAANGTCTIASAKKLCLQMKEQYETAERALGPFIDAYLNYKVKRASMELTACELFDEVEKQVLDLELKVAAARIGSAT